MLATGDTEFVFELFEARVVACEQGRRLALYRRAFWRARCPAGWSLCNGSANTPNLVDSYVKAGTAFAANEMHWVATWGASPAPQLADDTQMSAAKLIFNNSGSRILVGKASPARRSRAISEHSSIDTMRSAMPRKVIF